VESEERVSRTCLCGEQGTGVHQQFVDSGWTFKCRPGAVVGAGAWLCMACSAKEVPVAPSPSTVEQAQPAQPAIDREFVVMSEVNDLILSLDQLARERVIGWLKARWL
jgi:hypothetical protein